MVHAREATNVSHTGEWIKEEAVDGVGNRRTSEMLCKLTFLLR
jgi:hypothetical protein